MSEPIEFGEFAGILQANYSAVDFVGPFDAISEDLTKSHVGYFAAQVDPNGAAWAPLAASTVRRRFERDMGGRAGAASAQAAGFTPDATILIDTGAMKASVGFRGNTNHVERMSPLQLEWGTRDEHAAIHQFGTGNIPARPFVGWNTQAIDSAANRVADSAVQQLLAGL